jgi:hypothetical protein
MGQTPTMKWPAARSEWPKDESKEAVGAHWGRATGYI